MKQNQKLVSVKDYKYMLVFALFAIGSYVFDFSTGVGIASSFSSSLIEMISFVPFVFLLVGLVDVWVPKEKIERHMGRDSGVRGVLGAIFIAMISAGPLYGAFPIAYMLYKKGASVKNIFIYLGAFSALKLPMMSIEAGYLGIRFTIIRTLVSVPIFVVIGFIMERYLSQDYEIMDGSGK